MQDAEKRLRLWLGIWDNDIHRVQKKSRLHGCEPEEGFLNLCLF